MFNVAEVIDYMQAAADTLPVHPCLPKGITQLGIELLLQNYELWNLEDQAREKIPDYEAVGHIKEQIDRVNQKRNDLIGQIDKWIGDDLKEDGVDTNTSSGFTETPGMALDRLSILMLRIRSLHDLSAANHPTSMTYQMIMQRYSIARQQRDHLVRTIRPMLQMLYSGQARHIVWHALKLYNTPELRMASEKLVDSVKTTR